MVKGSIDFFPRDLNINELNKWKDEIIIEFRKFY